jgi:hypothetical protein
VLPGGASDFVLTNITAIDLDGAGTTLTIQPGQVIRVAVPRYWSDEVAPAAIRLEWLVQIAEKVDDNLQKNDAIPFAMTPAAVSADNPGAYQPTPARPNNSGTVAVNWPPAPPNAVSSTLGSNTSGCTIVRDENNANETSGGACP